MKNSAKGLLVSLPCAMSLAVSQAVTAQSSGTDGSETRVLEEIIVSAQRRDQNIQDVANSVEAFSGAEMDVLGKTSLEDFITSVGGVGLTRSGSGAIKIGMRGVSPIAQDDYAFGTTVSTTGMYLNDVPVQGGGAIPDLDLYDLQRVEVLKGPQGTLYGEGAMGGAVKLILNQPDLANFEAKAEASLLSTENADLGYRVRGAVNVPIVEDTFAARIVGSVSEKPGYIDNIATGEDGINDSDHWSLRGTFLWQATDRFEAELLLMHDELDMDGLPQTINDLGDLETDVLEDEFNNVETDLAAITLRYDFDFAQLTSVTSWFTKERAISQRLPFGIDEVILPPFGFPPLGFSDNESLAGFDEEETFTQEIRLVSSEDRVVDWTAGFFYRDRNRDICSYYDSPAAHDFNDLVTSIGLDFFAFPETTFDCGLTPPSGLDIVSRTAEENFEQLAIYGEINWELTDTLELTAGARYFDEEVEFADEQIGYGLLSFFTVPTVSDMTSDDDILFKLGLSWTPNDDQLYYFNISEGFRSGGTNLNAIVTTEPELYRTFQSDELVNYELGAKTTWIDGRLTLNGALYYSDWSDIQAQIFVPSVTGQLTGVLTSGGDGRIQGVEVQLNYLATENFSAGFTLNVQDAEFSDPTPESNIVKGSQMPNAPDLTASAYLQYTQPTSFGDWFGRLEYLHVDDQRTVTEPVVIQSPPYDDASTILPSYDVLNLTLGLSTDRWYLNAYARNLTDERYGLDYGYGQAFVFGSNPDRTSIGLPRTLGVTVGVNF